LSQASSGISKRSSLPSDVKTLKSLVYFYDSFLKLALRGVESVVGEKGARAILKSAAREYGVEVCRRLVGMKRDADLLWVLDMVLKRAGTEPELRKGEREVLVELHKCPFLRPSEEPLLCTITEGLLEGLGHAFNVERVESQGTMAQGAKSCVFKLVLSR